MSFLKQKSLGVTLAVLTAVIWAAFLLATRFAVQTNFTIEEVLVLRLTPAAIVMIPLMFKFDLIPRGQNWFRSLILMIGASAIFPYLVSKGLAFASAADGGALAPGLLPFWTAFAAYFILGETLDKQRKFGLILIFFGVCVIGIWDLLLSPTPGAWRGHILFVVGSGFFSVYSIIFRQSGLSPIHGLVIGLFWGTILVMPLMYASGNVTFTEVQLRDIILMVVLQSFLIAILATITFNYAVKLLGAAETGAFGALTPLLALIGSLLLLGETVTDAKIFGIVAVAFGVFLASGILSKHKNS